MPITLLVKGDEVTTKIKSLDSMELTTKFTLKLDEKASPKAFDPAKTKIDFGGDVGETDADDGPAINELKADEWKICLVSFGSPRRKTSTKTP